MPNEKSPKAFDAIVLGNSVTSWLRRKQAMPSEWGLNPTESARITDSGIRITMMYAPASALKLSPNPLVDVSKIHVIIFEANSIADTDLTSREIVSLLLHEIGHAVNPPPQTSSLEGMDLLLAAMPGERAKREEFSADDYARHCGYENEIASSLRKLQVFDPKRFGSNLIGERIGRIVAGSPMILNLV